MASRSVCISDLKVVDLKRELEERDLETSGNKASLKKRLMEALEGEGHDASTYLFDVPGDVTSMLNQVLENCTTLKNELLENSTTLEKKLSENILEHSTNLEKKLLENSTDLEKKLLENSTALENKLLENSTALGKLSENCTTLKKELLENSTVLEIKLSEKILEHSTALEKKLSEEILEKSTDLEKKFLENSTALEKKLSVNNKYLDTRLEEFEEQLKDREVSIAAEIETIKLAMSEIALKKSEPSKRIERPELFVKEGKDTTGYATGEPTKIRMKPPQFDGTSSWNNYLMQFEAAATANGWRGNEKATALILALRGQATDVLQTLSVEEQADYQQLACSTFRSEVWTD
jgi:SAP domain-containing protein